MLSSVLFKFNLSKRKFLHIIYELIRNDKN